MSTPKPEDLKCNTCSNCLGLKQVEGTSALALRCVLKNRMIECIENDFSEYSTDEDLKANNLIDDQSEKKSKSRKAFEVITSEESPIKQPLSKLDELFSRIGEALEELDAHREQENILRKLSREGQLFITDMKQAGTYMRFKAKEETTIGITSGSRRGFQEYSVSKNQVIEGVCVQKATLNPIVKDLITESMYEAILEFFGKEAYFLDYQGKYGIALHSAKFEPYVE